jgi:hypothetical protein
MLRHIISTLTGCALVGMVSVWAQEPPPAQSNKQQAKETLTGCVMEAKTTDGNTAYVLNKVEGGSAAMYVLMASTQSEAATNVNKELATNVNKKVEVTGPVQQPQAPPNDAPSNPKVLRPPIVRIESMKLVAENCS